MRKIFDVMIYEKYYDVYDIDGKEHHGLNGEPKTWWVYFSDRLPEGTLPPIDSDSWEPWHVGIKRCVWDIKLKQRNSTKEKWGDTQFNNHISVEMNCNWKLFYSFGTFDMAFAMAKVQYLQVIMSEHPFNFFDPKKENGRLIWGYNLPATVVVNNYNPWEIKIRPDYTTGLSRKEWWDAYKERKSKKLSAVSIFIDEDWDDIEEEEGNCLDESCDLIGWGDALFDGNIWWFREKNK